MHNLKQPRRSLRLPVDDSASYSHHPHHAPPQSSRRATATSNGSSTDDEALDAVLLRAIEPPDHSRLSLNGRYTLQHMKLTSRKKKCFKQLLTRVQMSIWTLHFQAATYEASYCAYLYEHAIPRIRYALSIAFVFLLLKTVYEKLNASSSSSSSSQWEIVLLLHTLVALPVLLVVIVCTHIRRLDRFCELYATVPFVLVTAILTTQKVLLQSRGPIFALFLVFVPVFGITRFRFSTSATLVAVMFTGHVVGLLVFQHAELSTDVLFQAYNYFGGIVVGAVCHYRAEVLRRRNYAMMLPFSDEPLDSVRMHRKLHDPRLKKHTLMSRVTLKFRNSEVEDTFYRHWYLIDPCPFDHPNAGELHRNVYRSVRFAVGGVIFSQLMLVVQDWEYLYSDSSFPYASYVFATCLRFTIVIPAYGISPFIMLFCGTRFYWQWRKQAASEHRGGTHSPLTRSAVRIETSSSQCDNVDASSYLEIQSPVAIHSFQEASHCSQTSQTSQLSQLRRTGHPFIQEKAPFRQNYVRFLQWLSTGVVFCHALAMGVILLLVDQLASQRNASVAPCYFLGFLNALLFPHRSGFRVRFVYATVGTVCVAVLFIAAALAVENDKVETYASYMALTNILGMMISHEEESLRRIFFVRMMLRSDEFRRRHDAILTLEQWFKDAIRRRRKAQLLDLLRKREQEAQQQQLQLQLQLQQQQQSQLPRGTSFKGMPGASVQIPTVNQMAQASKVGMSLELSRVAIALLTELV